MNEAGLIAGGVAGFGASIRLYLSGAVATLNWAVTVIRHISPR